MKSIPSFKKNSLLFILIILISVSCNNTEKTSEPTSVNDSDSSASNITSTTTKLLSLPAPMQIATRIKKINPKYYGDLLAPIKSNFTSDFYKTVILGIYAVDLGYSSIYDQKQSSLNYFSNTIKMADELKMQPLTDAAIIGRYKNNSDNKDSLTYFTLNTFKNINTYLTGNNRSDEAYLLLAGSFIEGMYLTAHVYEKNKSPEIIQLLGQQKFYLENIIQLLSLNKGKEAGSLAFKLNELNDIFKSVEIKYGSHAALNTQKIESINIPDAAIKEIAAKVKDIRNNILVN